MNPVLQASLFLMAAGMGTVFLSLAVFFVLIGLLKKIFKNSGAAEDSPSS